MCRHPEEPRRLVAVIIMTRLAIITAVTIFNKHLLWEDVAQSRDAPGSLLFTIKAHLENVSIVGPMGEGTALLPV